MTLPLVTETVGPDMSDVSRRSTKRSFDTAYKQRIVTEYQSLPAYGSDRGAILRREGLHSRQIHEWMQTLGMKHNKSGGDSGRARRTFEQIENDRLRARNSKLEAELARTKLALEITGKAHALLELLAESADTENPSLRS
jgi:transposase